jgi:hypothetical protein
LFQRNYQKHKVKLQNLFEITLTEDVEFKELSKQMLDLFLVKEFLEGVEK